MEEQTVAVSDARTARNGAGTWAAAPPPGAVPGKRRRVRPVRVWIGLFVAVVCAGGFVVAARGAEQQRTSVLVVAQRVEAGQVVQRADLREAELRGNVSGVPVSSLDEVVGRVAVVPLVPGSLLARDQVGEAAGFPPAGQALVAVSVRDGGAPPGLAVGQRVAVLAGPGQAAGPQTGAGASPSLSAEGVVVAVRAAADATGGGFVVTLLVDAASGSKVAVLVDPRLVVLSSAAGGGAG
ncbi:SAF domain-containing protein [Yinghuangia sp. ASG 101]|uniref:SAF domain-containing protein n=1 Tax=Yinghuangia sp. ASG 101 TaxID=2896848 RepID=UPI001E32D5B0|nr:SAF domain-containing protein [Yinghuangia sp. ASG 101]UGQ15608.1 SAF domain-containing protein [Yinghuangia sp. ASG 101]